MTLFFLLACAAVIIILYRPPTKLVMFFSEYCRQVGGTHPTEMLSCLSIFYFGNRGGGVRGPESTFRVPYKVVIRVQQLVPFAQASIG